MENEGKLTKEKMREAIRIFDGSPHLGPDQVVQYHVLDLFVEAFHRDWNRQGGSTGATDS